MNDYETGLYIDISRLPNLAKNTASAGPAQGTVPGRRVSAATRAVLTRLKSRLAPSKGGAAFSQAREWFSDNWYIAEREGKDAAAALRQAGRLPGCAGTDRALVSEAASALIRSGRGEVTPERIRVFLDAYQTVSVLSERELSMFVPALKAELCAYLDAVCPQRLPDAEDRELAALFQSIFTSLRLLSGVDVSDILESVDRVESLLRRDPAGIYPLMDEDTRRLYRRRLEREARRAHITQYDAAQKVLELSGDTRHVGDYIFKDPLGRGKRAPTGGWYLSLLVLATMFFTVLSGFLTASPLVPALLILPVSELVKTLTDFAALKLTRPTRLPRMELPHGVPAAARTICVISALLTSPEDGPRYARLLEEYRLANRDAGPELLFGILADLRESPSARARDDAPILESAAKAVDSLNGKYGGGFLLLTRDRELNAADNIWMGRERKRGAIEELVRLLTGDRSALHVASGDPSALTGCAFILTLDADTRLTAGAARELIGAALHPLNTPVIDEKQGRVVSGYGIYQPRVAVDLRSAGKSGFSRIYGGQGGVDPYGSAVSDLYQDLFGQGTFMGKGLINVPVYKKLLLDRVPDNTVLSHDILEGAYMGCAYVSDLEFTDGCPYKATGWFARQERWTRGDWQNLRWILPHVKDRSGALVPNTLTPLSRWKLFDNLRRSLMPPAVLACLLAALLTRSGAMAACGLVALAAELSGLILSSAELLVRRDGSLRARYRSDVLPGVTGAAARSAMSLALLPAEAWIQLRAVLTALYRMLISRRRMLAWVTSSEAERRHGSTLYVNYRALLACPIAGLVLLFLTPYPPAGAIGVIWLLAPILAWALSRPRTGDRPVSAGDRAYLMGCAADIWKYFDENLTESDGYLPPDNVQTEPDLGRARRTSPTNIGLAMLSCAAASDLGLIDESDASRRVKNTLATVIRLEKWNGHLYNWYDTSTLLPMEPRYVSAVDSGNLAGALITLRQWFLRRGEAEPAAACDKLIRETDFTALYDPRRRLFRIGWDVTRSAPTEGWYDLLASEARETSFIAAALGQVPRKHWRRLGRALVSLDNYSGMASWTGTMFEYLMPNLILPCCPDSLIAESSRFCLYAQKRAAARANIPWGISESAYYAFDPGLSYRYKAHGVQRLALKRGMGEERVVSPYSSFLALPLDTHGAVKNLRRLASLGMTGRYGFYEAADFTPSRMTGGKCQVVRCFMVHHLGMSLVAIANTLCGDVFPRRFMSDVRMAAFSELLEERVPIGQTVLRQPPREVPVQPRRQESGGWTESFSGIDGLEPRCLPLSNGSYHLLAAETGACRARWHDLDVYRFEPEPTGAPGVAAYLRAGEELIPLTAAPDFDAETECTAVFTPAEARYRAKRGSWSAEMTVTVPPSAPGEARYIKITGPADAERAELILTFEPVLDRLDDYLAHPAFSRLMLEAAVTGGALTVSRRPREGRDPVSLAVAASGELRAVTHCRRGDPIGAGELLPASPDIRVTVTVPVKLRDRRGEAAVAIALAPTPAEAASAAGAILKKRETQSISRIGAAALMLGMRQADIRSAMLKLTPLIYRTARSTRRTELMRDGLYGRESLWRFGISGSEPIMAARVAGEEQLEALGTLIREHALLAENGVRADLAIIITDGGDYRSAQREAALETLRRAGREHTLRSPGGVFILEDGPETMCLEALCDLFVDLSAIPAAPEHRIRYPRTRPPYRRGTQPVTGRLTEGAYSFAISDTLPEAAWSHIITNGDFGYLATECGAGFMWYMNSRLMKLTSAPTEAMSHFGGEELYLIRGGQRLPLFAAGDGRPTLVEYSYNMAAWERELEGIRSRLTATVPYGRPMRILRLELTGDLTGAEVEYCARLTMGEVPGQGRSVLTEFSNNTFTVRTGTGELRGMDFKIMSTETPTAYTASYDSYLMGDFDNKTDPTFRPCVAFRISAAEVSEIRTGFGGVEDEVGGGLAAEKSAKTALGGAWRHKNAPDTRLFRVKIATPDDRINNYVNFWAPYQTIYCRLLARTGLYQNGGATGFRDQLQDASALLLYDPELFRKQIILAANHQYFEGDVQHWWHTTPNGPDAGRGVRTHCSDDLLWLPWALCDYLERTGDMSILHEKARYLSSKLLQNDEKDRYEAPNIHPEQETVLRHALRACDLYISRGEGPHGLSLILGGDWCDGFDAIGRDGRGESLWLTLFGAMTLRKMSDLLTKIGEAEDAERLGRKAFELLRAADGGWTGEWYLRGWYGSGEPLGAPADRDSGGVTECEIDSIAQSFSVFAGLDYVKSKTAVNSAFKRLADLENRVVKLFDPPFSTGSSWPGYVKSYAPGFRENGGQYTHAAIWLAMALFRRGEAEKAASILSAVSPWGRDMKKYAAEPYVLAGDISSAPGLLGRAGWSWYTGSAGWYIRAVTEELLGLRLRGGVLHIEPNLPDPWPEAHVTLEGPEGPLNIDIYHEGVMVNGEPAKKEGYRLIAPREPADMGSQAKSL